MAPYCFSVVGPVCLGGGQIGVRLYGRYEEGLNGGMCNNWRVSCVQKLPRTTFVTLIAISTFATQTWRAIVVPLPSFMKSTSIKCLCLLSSDVLFVSRSLCILAVNSCCREESPSMTWCTLLFLYSHCLCVIDIKLLMNLAPHRSTEPLGLYWWSIGCTVSIKIFGILPSTKQSHPRLLIANETWKYQEWDGVQSFIVCWPWASRYVLIISDRSWSTFLLLSLSIMPSIDWRSCISQPGSVHWVRCLEFSCLHPHWGHLLWTLSSQSNNFELHPHQPDTCFVTNVRKVWDILPLPFCIHPTKLSQSV